MLWEHVVRVQIPALRMIKEIVTHFRPHADELVALMLLKKFPEGEKKFPGVSTAKISFLSTGELPEGKTADDFPETIFLGCGGGMFDEHATSQKERVEGEICATLVAKYLGLDRDEALQKTLFFLKEEDLHGSKVKNELPMVIKFIHQYSTDAEKIYQWTETAYFADFLKEEKDSTPKDKWQRPTLENTFDLLKKEGNSEAENWKKFADEAIKFRQEQFEKAKKEFRELGKMEKIIAWDGKPLMVAHIESDNEEMNKYARSNGAHLVVQFTSRGNVSIMTDTKRKIDLSKAFVLLRLAEQHFRGGIKVKDGTELSKEGFVKGIPTWYLFHTKAMGFNGSLTASNVEPTKIPHQKVIELVKEGLR